MNENLQQHRHPGMRGLDRRLTRLMMCASLAILIGVSLFSLIDARREARTAWCTNRLHAIAVALADYHEVHGEYPPRVTFDGTGRPMHSWRALLLPHLIAGQELARTYRFDEPWDGPTNTKLAGIAPSVYQCPNGMGDREECSYFLAAVEPHVLESLLGSNRMTYESLQCEWNALVEWHGTSIEWSEPADIAIEAVNETTPSRSEGAFPHTSLDQGGFALTTESLEGRVVRPLASVPKSDRPCLRGSQTTPKKLF